ncbi:polysaccharide pyruvyl transferase family protein [Noviherbaspirillum cavernae]|uniref:Polysaccharide pyruvyl transferase family protein n=2 Tax=Noviherbaspirillum cavernae TaxID=2320862 RepID=A0A418WWG7_9BURK|nr:polysaccharide pyruvyl transferase family protein [Noviherbaspirillum cavernae]
MPGELVAQECPTILFGAFDRHNFGDLLFPHIAAALLNDENIVFAGLAERDMRNQGGHRVEAIARLATQWQHCAVNVIHAGGELLGCDAWQAAVMLQTPRHARSIVAQYDGNRQDGLAWARRMIGLDALAPYVLSRDIFPHVGQMIHNAIGGVEIDECDAMMRAEILARLRAADAVGVREKQSMTLLQAHGIATRLMPDPAVMVADLFDARIRQRADAGEVARMRTIFPRGYIAVQFSAGYGDDATLREIAAQLDQVAAATGYGIVFFRAGAAPWHDELACYRRVAQRMHAPASRIFASLNLWDICALLARSHAYCGSSLHGRIVAMAYALPRINLRHPARPGGVDKVRAYADTWDEGMPATAEVHAIAAGILHALSADAEPLRRKAAALAAQYRQAFDALCAGLRP